MLGIEDIFPLLIKGRDGVRGLVEETKKLGGVIPPEMANRANDLQHSFTALDLAVEGFGHRLADNWGQIAKPYLDGTTDWISKNQKVAESYSNIGLEIMALGTLRPALWVARLLGIGPSIAAAAVMNLHGDTDPNATPDGFRKGWVPDNGPAPTPYTGQTETFGQMWRRSVPTWMGGDAAEATPGAKNINPPSRGSAGADVMKETHDFWISKGFTEQQTAGILANIAAESSFNPSLPGDHGNAYGLYQDNGTRKNALMQFAHTDAPTVAQQNDYAWSELNSPRYSGVLAAMRTAQDSSKAAGIWSYGFESPSGGASTPNGQLDRMAAAHKFDGAVAVTIDIRGAPPGTRTSVTASGHARVAPPRTETAVSGWGHPT